MATERKGLTPDQVEDIRTKWRRVGDAVQAGQSLNEVGLLLWYAEHVGDLLSTTDRQTARIAALEAENRRLVEAVPACTKSLEFRDGVTCSRTGSLGVCTNHEVVAGLRHHAVEADQWELRARALVKALTSAHGIIHEGLHGGRPTDPEHQEQCQRPACVKIRAALSAAAASSEGRAAAAGEEG